MKSIKGLSGTLLCFGLSLVTATAGADVVAPSDPIAGNSQADLSWRWWQWAIDTRTADDPVSDPTGSQGFRGDQGDYFFLAGSYSGDPVTRSLTIPAGRTLFLPLVNAFIDNLSPFGEPPTDYTSDELRDFITPFIDTVTGLYLTIDGVSITGLDAHRQQSPFSYTVTDPDNFLTRIGYDPTNGSGVYPATVSLAFADGYYVGIQPLSPGRHTLRFGGQADGVTQNIEYTLDVVPEPGTLMMIAAMCTIVGIRRR